MKKILVFILMSIFSSLPILLGQNVAADIAKWHLPKGAVARLGKGFINDIAYSPDGKHLAVVSDIGVWIYDAQNGTEQALLPAAPGKAVSRVVFSPNGHILAVIGDMWKIQLWDYRSQTLKGSLVGRSYSPTGVVFSPDGRTIAIMDIDQTTQLWDVKTMKFKCTLEGSTDAVANEGMEYFSVAYSPDGNVFAIGSEDGTIRLWDTTTGKLKHTLIGNITSVGSFCFSPDGKTIATRSFTGSVWLWDTTTGRHKITLEYAVSGENIAYSPDGETIAVIVSGTILLLDATTGEQKSNFEIGVEKLFSFSPDGTIIAAVKENGIVQVWDTKGGIPLKYGFEEETRVELEVPIATGKHKYTFECADSVGGIVFSPDGGTLTTVNANNTVQVWNTKTGELKYTLEHTSSVIGVSFSKFSNFNEGSKKDSTLITVHSDKTVRQWNTKTHVCQRTFSLTKHTDAIHSVAFSPDGRTLATASFDGHYLLWEIPSGLFKETLAEDSSVSKNDFVGSFSPDGDKFALGVGGSVEIFELAPAKVKKIINNGMEHRQGWIRGIAYSPKGDIIATGTDSDLILWDTIIGTPMNTHDCEFLIRNLAFSPDGRTIAISTSNDTLLWDIQTWTLKHTLDGNSIVAFSPDGRTIATSYSWKGTVQLWDTKTGAHKDRLIGHGSGVKSIAYSPDGKIIATAGEDGTVFLWSLASHDLNTK
ncbi:PQQ-binding-like beta-propeller repeat protein [Candidatus Poribacteria bacterium]|nr:PQQ-binding-like beta-propeller repeat protein [Candidatus Poribacteria bacterium]